MKLYNFVLPFLIGAIPLKAQDNTSLSLLHQSKALEEKSKEEAAYFLNTLQKAPMGKTCHKCPIKDNPLSKNVFLKPSSPSTDSKTELLIFVSLSLGANTLKQLCHNAQRIGGRLILRGLYKDSFRLTQQKIKALKIVVDIDPTLFEQFNIKEVPTFILTEPYQNNTPFKYDQLAGNVTLAYVLEKFRDEGEINKAGSLFHKLKERSHA